MPALCCFFIWTSSSTKNEKILGKKRKKNQNIPKKPDPKKTDPKKPENKDLDNKDLDNKELDIIINNNNNSNNNNIFEIKTDYESIIKEKPINCEWYFIRSKDKSFVIYSNKKQINDFLKTKLNGMTFEIHEINTMFNRVNVFKKNFNPKIRVIKPNKNKTLFYVKNPTEKIDFIFISCNNKYNLKNTINTFRNTYKIIHNYDTYYRDIIKLDPLLNQLQEL